MAFENNLFDKFLIMEMADATELLQAELKVNNINAPELEPQLVQL